jgi:hypothetical protein
VRAAAWAAVLSGAPSTVWAVTTKRDPLEATLAAGRLLLPDEARRVRLLASAAVVHGALSMGWTVVLSRLPGSTLAATAAGAAIAGLDLGAARLIGGARFGPTAELPLVPQIADHLAFGAIAGWLLAH